ncbi:hypothetical protein KDX31_07960 [Amphritea atlantica]|uniref:Uncharacterized protein n=1 Tax=Amphritea atlantica TaxID=355243 RepID=A0ABY5GY28_9GAMM|nr:hypothetical protein KDX31_07960 [Amphritea atlantica]
MAGVSDGILIGGAGGAIAGITVYLVQYIHNKWRDFSDSRKVYKWLSANSSPEDGKSFRSTRAIASYNNMTIDRVRYICSQHQKIYLSTGKNEDLWSIHGREQKGFFDVDWQ